MRILVLYDNDVYLKGKGLESEWGFSALIDNGDERILFDTGGDGKILLKNMKALDIDPSSIDKIVISHEHWDHNGGLDAILPKMEKAKLWDQSDGRTPENIQHNVVKGPVEISQGINSTGSLKGDPVSEQSLVLEGSKGLWVLVGCSHPGVGNILKASRVMGNVIGLAGGFHGLEDMNVLKDLDHIYPMHCTVKRKQILEEFPKTARQGGIGLEIEI